MQAVRYRYHKLPPKKESIVDSAVDVGLSIVINQYPYFSDEDDCSKALGDVMSRQCNRPFDVVSVSFSNAVTQLNLLLILRVTT